MSNQKNRTNRSNSKPQTKEVKEVKEEIVEEEIQEVEEVKEEPVEEVEEEVTEIVEEIPAPVAAKEVKAIVSGCVKLRLRKTPVVEDNNIIAELLSGTKITIKEDNGDWALVETSTGTGYVMTKFLQK